MNTCTAPRVLQPVHRTAAAHSLLTPAEPTLSLPLPACYSRIDSARHEPAMFNSGKP
jgi:hypothetical protein